MTSSSSMQSPKPEVLDAAFHDLTGQHLKEISPGEATVLLEKIPDLDKKLESKNITRQDLETHLNGVQKSLFRKILDAGGKTVDIITWPVRKILWPPIKWYLKHPIRNTLLVALAVILLLYLTPAPPGPGGFRDDLIKQGEEILKKTGVPTPQVATEAIAKVGATGAPVAEQVIKQGEQLLESPANILEHIQKSKILEERMKKLGQP